MNVLTPDIRWTLLAIFLTLLASSLIVEAIARNRPEKDLNVSRSRIQSWWILAGTFTFAIVVNQYVALVFFAFISFIALKEYFTLIPTRHIERALLFWAYLAVPAQYTWVAMKWYPMFMIFIPVYMFVFLPVSMVITGRPSGFLRLAGVLHWGLMITVFSLSHVAYLVALPDGPGGRVVGAGLLVYLVLLTELNNVFQYVWARIIGRKRIAPRINPARTWWGLVCGIATTTLVAIWLAPYLTPMGHRGALFAGLIIGAGGFLGDMTISMLKRDLRVRETGSYIPGHGGVLDRVDSLTFTAPVFFHYIRFFYFL